MRYVIFAIDISSQIERLIVEQVYLIAGTRLYGSPFRPDECVWPEPQRMSNGKARTSSPRLTKRGPSGTGGVTGLLGRLNRCAALYDRFFPVRNLPIYFGVRMSILSVSGGWFVDTDESIVGPIGPAKGLMQKTCAARGQCQLQKFDQRKLELGPRKQIG
jgi:hypothetical protein